MLDRWYGHVDGPMEYAGSTWPRHHVEEVGNLVHFLPGLWAGRTGVAPDRTRRR
jgi:hypothetical protein